MLSSKAKLQNIGDQNGFLCFFIRKKINSYNEEI